MRRQGRKQRPIQTELHQRLNKMGVLCVEIKRTKIPPVLYDDIDLILGIARANPQPIKQSVPHYLRISQQATVIGNSIQWRRKNGGAGCHTLRTASRTLKILVPIFLFVKSSSAISSKFSVILKTSSDSTVLPLTSLEPPISRCQSTRSISA